MTPAACGRCPGDCNGDCEVTIDEILRLVNIALGTASVDICPAGDIDGNREITIDEIVAAVSAALNGCPPPPSPTATSPGGAATPTSTIAGIPPSPTATNTLPAQVPTATATNTPPAPLPSPTPSLSSAGSLGRNSARVMPLLARALASVPAMLSSVSQIADGGRSARRADDVRSCNQGGTLDFTCTQTTPGVSPRDYAVGFDSCNLGAGAGSVSLNGQLTGRSTETGFLAICSLPPLMLSTLNIGNLEVVVRDGGGGEVQRSTFNVNGTLAVAPEVTSSCRVAALDLTLTGNITTVSPDATTSMTLNATRLQLQIDLYSADCVPLAYRLRVDGPLGIDAGAAGVFQGSLAGLVMQVTDSGTRASLTGAINSGCFDGAATLASLGSLVLSPTSVCPAEGGFLISQNGVTTLVSYFEGTASLDIGHDGELDEDLPSCLGAVCN